MVWRILAKWYWDTQSGWFGWIPLPIPMTFRESWSLSINYICVMYFIDCHFLVYTFCVQNVKAKGTIHIKTHWGRVTHICVSKLTGIGSDTTVCELAASLSRPQCVNIRRAGRFRPIPMVILKCISRLMKGLITRKTWEKHVLTLQSSLFVYTWDWHLQVNVANIL